MLRRISSSISDLLNIQHHKSDKSMPSSHLLSYPLHYAAQTKNLALVNKLLSKPTNFIDQEDDQGRTALNCAMSQTCHQIVECLLNNKASVDCVDYQGNTAAHLAVKQGDLLYLTLLLQHNADCLIGDRYGKNVLDLVCEYGEQAMFEVLIERGVLEHLVRQLSTNHSADNAGFSQSSALGLAARNGHVTICAQLLEHKFPINVFTAQGSALHESCINGEWQVVKLLLYKGIDHTITDICGQTALQIAQTYLVKSKWSVVGEETVLLLQNYPRRVFATAICNYDPLHGAGNSSSHTLSFVAGQRIWIVEQDFIAPSQHQSTNPSCQSPSIAYCKGIVFEENTGQSTTGYFPSSLVHNIEYCDKADSMAHVRRQNGYRGVQLSCTTAPGQEVVSRSCKR